MKKLFFVAVLFLVGTTAFAQKKVSATSPDGQTKLTVTITDRIYYDVESHGEMLFEKCHIGMNLREGVLGGKPSLKSKKVTKVNETITPIHPLKSKIVQNNYTLLTLAMGAALASCSEDNDPTYLDEVRVSSSYVAIPMSGGSTSITIDAASDWNFVSQRWIQGKDTIYAATPQWLDVNFTSGVAGKSDVTFTAPSTLDGRSCEVLLSCGGKTQRINIIQGVSSVSEVSVAEVMAGPDKTYRVTGTVTRIANTVYGNWYMNDGTSADDLYIYGTLDKAGKSGQNNSIAAWGIEVGDEVTVEDPKTVYGSTVELVNVTVVKINKSLIKVDALSSTDPLPAEGGEVTATITCKGNGVTVEIPEEAKSWLVTRLKLLAKQNN